MSDCSHQRRVEETRNGYGSHLISGSNSASDPCLLTRVLYRGEHILNMGGDCMLITSDSYVEDKINVHVGCNEEWKHLQELSSLDLFIGTFRLFYLWCRMV